MHLPFFSVVIPTYNRASTIYPALLSVQNQTFKDFECIVVDDGSTDHSELLRVVSELNDPRFKVIWRENGGGGAARNTGIDAAVGHWIAFLDSDDQFSTEKLEETYRVINNSTQKSVICSYIEVDRGDGIKFIKPHRSPKENENIAKYLMSDRGFIQTSTMAVENGFAKQIKFDPDLPFSQDTDFCVRLWAAGAKFKMIEYPLVFWNDMPSAARVSSNKKSEALETWLENIRETAGASAYWGYKGWHIAKLLRRDSFWRPLSFWLVAVLRGSYSVKLAATVFLQVFLSEPAYRSLSDFLVKKFRAKV